MQEGEAFGPSRGHIGERQRVDIASLNVGATMSHEIRFQKAGLGLLPLLERANRDLLLQQRSRSRGGEAALTHPSLGTQEAISCRCAHGKELASTVLCEVKMLMPFQCF